MKTLEWYVSLIFVMLSFYFVPVALYNSDYTRAAIWIICGVLNSGVLLFEEEE